MKTQSNRASKNRCADLIRDDVSLQAEHFLISTVGNPPKNVRRRDALNVAYSLIESDRRRKTGADGLVLAVQGAKRSLHNLLIDEPLNDTDLTILVRLFGNSRLVSQVVNSRRRLNLFSRADLNDIVEVLGMCELNLKTRCSGSEHANRLEKNRQGKSSKERY